MRKLREFFDKKEIILFCCFFYYIELFIKPALLSNLWSINVILSCQVLLQKLVRKEEHKKE